MAGPTDHPEARAATRREFVGGVAAAAAAAACALCPAAQALAAGRAAPRVGRVDAGPLAAFDRDGVFDDWAKDCGFFLVRDDGRLYALSARCTHKNVGLVVRGDRLKCPKHGSIFTLDGEVTKAPAKRSLPRYGISVDGGGSVIVDGSREFGPDESEEPGSFIAL
jgi:nitrite reductase/ring-hydroxylating ferredoxin subunit